MSDPGPTSRPRAAQVSRLSLVLLAIMTIATVAGPVGVFATIRGGREAYWPPDRPVEWAVLIGTCALVGGLMVALLAIGLSNLKAMKAEAALERRPGSEP